MTRCVPRGFIGMISSNNSTYCATISCIVIFYNEKKPSFDPVNAGCQLQWKWANAMHFLHATMYEKLQNDPLTLTKFVTAVETACTGLLRSGISWPASPSSWMMTSRDT